MKVLSVTAILLCLTASAAAQRKSYPMNVPAVGVEKITFKVEEGNFVLRGDPSATEVRMKVSIDRTFIFKLGEERILKRLIKLTGEGTEELTIATDIPHSILNWGRAQYPIDFEIVVPATVRLSVHDTSGTIVISDMHGDVEIEDGSGTLAARRLGGKLDIEKKSGDIRLDDIAGPTRLRSESGQMHIERVAALEIVRSDGNLDLFDAKATRIRNTDGNIHVQRVAGDLTIEDDAGEIVVREVSGSVSIRDTSGQIRTSRTGSLTVYDTSGDVTVEQAAGLEVVHKESGEIVARGVRGQIHAPKGIQIRRVSSPNVFNQEGSHPFDEAK